MESSDNMEKKKSKFFDKLDNKSKIRLSVLTMVGVLLLSTGLSYAYFSATITNGSNGEETVVTSGTMVINYAEGNTLILNNAMPGTSGYKDFTVENTGDIEADYEIYLSEVLNTFVDKSDLVYSITSTDADVSILNQQAPSGPIKIVSNKTLPVGGTHHYRLILTFLNKDENQNDNQGARFSAKIGVNEAKDYQYIAKLMDGKSANQTIKLLSINLSDEVISNYLNVCDGNSPNYNWSTCNQYSKENKEDYDAIKNTLKGSEINDIQVVNYLPSAGTKKEKISANNSYYDIYAWYDNGTIYIYTDQDRIYLNEDSSSLFEDYINLNTLDLSDFDTSLVKNMSYFFSNTKNLETITWGDHFDTSNVTDMNHMFGSINNLEQIDLSNLNTSNVTNMDSMFYNTSATTLDLSYFDTSKVENMSYMFSYTNYDSYNFVNSLNTSKVKIMESMFSNAGNDQLILNLDIDASNVENLEYMFESANFKEINLNNFNLKNATRLRNMFYDTKSKKINLGNNFNVEKNANVSYMFYYLKSENISLGNNFNGKNITDYSNLFYDGDNLTTLDLGDNFDTSSATNMYSMFRYLGPIERLYLGEHFNTSNVENMYYMFGYSKIKSIDLGSNFDTSKATNMSYMFGVMNNLETIYLGDKIHIGDSTDVYSFIGSCPNLETIYVGEHSTFGPITNTILFYDLPKLKGGAGTQYSNDHKNAEYARIDDPNNGRPGYFKLQTS